VAPSVCSDGHGIRSTDHHLHHRPGDVLHESCVEGFPLVLTCWLHARESPSLQPLQVQTGIFEPLDDTTYGPRSTASGDHEIRALLHSNSCA
jgi:hypothetical protein